MRDFYCTSYHLEHELATSPLGILISAKSLQSGDCIDGDQTQPFATNSFGATPPIPAPIPTMNFGAAVPQQQQPPLLVTIAFGGVAQQPAPATSFGGFGGAVGGGFNIGTGGGTKTRGATRRRILRAKRPPSGKR